MKKIILFIACYVVCLLVFSQTDAAPTSHARFATATTFFTDLIQSNKKTLYGIASFYSRNLEGSITATGERFSHHLFTAASNNFPLGTYVKVTNLNNDKSVIVRINDRMHPRMQKKGRVVDLPIIAAKELDFIKAGITKVKVEVVQPPAKTEKQRSKKY
jgi:rare lipoprotein A